MSTTTTNLGLIKPELTDVADITAMNPNWDKIDTELKKAFNQTAEDVGAVPSGYGYGEQMMEVTSSATETYADYCAKIDAILAGMANRETKQINAVPPYSEDATFGACAVTIYKGTDAYASLVTLGHSNRYAYGWRMQKRAGVWEPFEWIEPPMNTGVEYRTTERINGKAVYKKNVDGVIQYRLDGETEWKPYASATGALPLAGGTMTGNGFYINNKTGRIVGNENGMWLRTASSDVDNNADSRHLKLWNATYVSELVRSLCLFDTKTGKDYIIYGQHNVTASTTDLTAGSSSLATGALYFVYE